MTELEMYEQELYDKNIITLQHALPGSIKACCFDYGKISINAPKAIVYDNIKMETSKELYFELAHEEMHLNHPETMYSLNDSLYIIKKKEYKNLRLMIRKFIPQAKLFDLIYNKKLDVEDISSLLSLPESLISAAYEYYSNLESWIKAKQKLCGESEKK